MGNSEHQARIFTIVGRVQGVGFRFHTVQKARSLGIRGWVRNRPDGSVEVYGEGSQDALAALSLWLKKGPPWAFVENVQERERIPNGTYRTFTIEY